MRRVRHSVGLSLAVAAVALSAACGPPKRLHDPFAERPIRTASGEELARSIDDDAAAVVGLRGKLTLGFQETARASFRTCRGALVARNPWTGGESGLYVKGYQSLIPTLFTLVSDGRRFWLHVPRDNVVYTGPLARRRGASGDRDVRLDARDLFRALFLQPLGDPADLDVEEEPSTYVVSMRREGRLHRRLWVERRRFTVQREVFYDATGQAELAIDRDRYVDVHGRLHPERMSLHDLVTGGTLLLEFDGLTLNPADLNADAFRPRLPPEARTQPVAGLEDDS